MNSNRPGRKISELRTPRLPEELRQALASSGLPWRITNGRKHFKVMIGERMVAVLSHGAKGQYADKNMMANIRRIIKEQSE